jgi:hypothetical protein
VLVALETIKRVQLVDEALLLVIPVLKLVEEALGQLLSEISQHYLDLRANGAVASVEVQVIADRPARAVR